MKSGGHVTERHFCSCELTHNIDKKANFRLGHVTQCSVMNSILNVYKHKITTTLSEKVKKNYSLGPVMIICTTVILGVDLKC